MLLSFAFLACEAQTVSKEVHKPRDLWAITFSPDGKYYAFGGDDSTLHINSAADHQLLHQYKMNSAIKNMDWQADNIIAIATMKEIQLFNFSTKQFNLVQNIGGARGMRWNKKGTVLGVAGNGIVYLVSKEGKLLHSFKKHNNTSFMALDWHPVNNSIVTVTDEIIVFDSIGKQLAFINHRKERAGILSVAFHPSDDFFATGDYGHESEGIPTLLQFWKTDGTLIKTINGNKSEIRNLRWSPDGKLLAVASDALRIYDRDGNLVAENKTLNHNLWGITWNNTGDKIFTASFDGSHVHVWNSKAELLKQVH